jgi:Xaa-Pro aminopeptidase
MDRKLILERHNRVEKSLRQNGVDAVVLFNVEGIGWEDLYYFSGFRGTSGIFVFGQNEKFLITDSRYILQAREQSPFSVIDKGDKEDIFLVESMLRDLGAKTVGINTKTLPSYLYLKCPDSVLPWSTCRIFWLPAGAKSQKKRSI